MADIADLDFEALFKEWSILNAVHGEAWNKYLSTNDTLETIALHGFLNISATLGHFYTRVGIDEKTFLKMLLDLGLTDGATSISARQLKTKHV